MISSVCGRDIWGCIRRGNCQFLPSLRAPPYHSMPSLCEPHHHPILSKAFLLACSGQRRPAVGQRTLLAKTLWHNFFLPALPLWHDGDFLLSLRLGPATARCGSWRRRPWPSLNAKKIIIIESLKQQFAFFHIICHALHLLPAGWAATKNHEHFRQHHLVQRIHQLMTWQLFI